MEMVERVRYCLLMIVVHTLGGSENFCPLGWVSGHFFLLGYFGLGGISTFAPWSILGLYVKPF